ncbi:ubiquitin carboxyl-terminal hydrolase 34-like isoform X2 [Babylonia areolata]|uniref:ubiquitin carboxyl-terminal hydrolase 34-like isoform X2 n=1 Tax=Babylonia areolata TaxID=304850 RepID=UPI003FD435D4
MCECGEAFRLMQHYETRIRVENGLHLSKEELVIVLTYFMLWHEKQCLCVFTKDMKNMERMNAVIQVILRTALQMIKILPDLYAKKQKQASALKGETAGSSTDSQPGKSEGGQPVAGASTSTSGGDEANSREPEAKVPKEDAAVDTDNAEEEDIFTAEEKFRLLEFTQKVFMTNFPLYQIQKSLQPVSLETLFFNPGAVQRLTEEDLMPFETSTISCYCDMTRIEKMSMNYNKQDEPSAFFLRNICFLCDTNLIQNIGECFKSPSIHLVPVQLVHHLIQFIANVRYWLNPETIIHSIMPLRVPVIRYLCSMPQSDLRSFANRGLTDSILSAVKETPDRPAGRTFDVEGLSLAYKFFNCESLSLRMAGIVQINNQIALYNEAIACGEVEEAPRFGAKLADWLVEKELVVKIFGPNIHMEIVKNSQMILTFLAMEYRLSNRDLDSIWSSCQLKHCSKQVYDALTALLKNLDSNACKHVRDLISKLDPAEHNESTVVIASTLDKLKWHVGMTHHHHLHQAAIQQQLQPHVRPYPALRNEAATTKGMGKSVKRNHDLSSSDSEREEDDTRKRSGRQKVAKKRRRSLPGKCVERSVDMESSGEEEENCCNMHHPLGAHAHHNPDIHEDSLGSDSSLGAQSDLSEDSIQEDRILEAAKIAEESTYGKHLHQHRHIHPNRAGMDSDECTETSEDEEAEEEEEDEEEDDEEDEEEAGFVKEEHSEIRTKKESLAVLKREHGKMIGPKKVCKDHGRKKDDLSAEEEGSEPSKKLNESSEMEPFEQEHTDVDLAYSDDEVLKQAEMVQMKPFHHESDSSEDDIEMHQIQNQGPSPNILQQAANIVMRQKIQPQHPVIGPMPQPGRARHSSLGESPDEIELAARSERLTGDASLVKGPFTQLPSLQFMWQGMDHGHRSSPLQLGDHHHLKRQVGIEGHQQVEQAESNYPENIMSPESGGSASPNSQLSDKPSHMLVKGFSDDELEQIHAQAQYSAPHVGPHLPIGNLYHHHMPKLMQHRAGLIPREQVVATNFTLDDVCKKGNTLIWDLVQDDVAAKLPEGLVVDAEKALHTLISFGVDRCIRAKFIEACVQNLAEHRTILISLRLLPKLFGSFQNYRGSSEIHNITRWAESELRLMHHFFEDVIHFSQTRNPNDTNGLHSYREEVQVRLSFLTMMFANTNTPDTFRMNEEQVDILWNCLAENPSSSDDCLQWFFNQAKSKEHHAMGLELFRHIFLEKIPRLNPENMTMIGLNLFQHLSHLTRISITPQTPLSEDQICGMDQLWEIALQATNQEVSMSATQYLNSYFLNYGGGTLEREELFIQRCMSNLMTALASLRQGPAVYIQRIHRGLILLKNHLELFSRRYAFHLRTLRLDGVGMTPHQAPSSGKCVIRLLLQPTGITEKTQIDMQATDLVSELRAEVTRWWEILQRQQQQQRQRLSELPAGHPAHSSPISPILGAMLGDGPIRMIFLGQELTVDVDDKTLGEMQLKDNQLVFVSVGASRPPKKQDGSVPSSCLPAPDRVRMPLALLTQEPHFGHLFTLLEKLSHAGSEMENLDAQERARLQAEARRLSRVVWELLMMLPTSPSHLQGFTQQSVDPSSGDASSKVDWDRLLPPDSPHRLYYSLQILEQLAYGKPPSKKTLMPAAGGDMLAFASEGTSGSNEWKTKFVSKGGVAHLLNIVMSGALQPHEGDSWSQWNQECLAYLLRIITQFSVEPQDKDSVVEDMETQDSPRKKLRRLREEKVVILRLMQSTMDMLNVEELLKILMKILYEAAYPADLNQLYLCSWGRAEVVSTALSLLVSVAYSSPEVHELQSATPDLTAWLKRLTLVAPEPYVRKEAAMGLYRLCLGHTADGDQNQMGRHYLVPILSCMLTFLSDAIQFKPERHSEIAGKEPFGPGCRDYFWLLCRLVEGYSKQQTAGDQNPDIDLNDIASRCANLVLTRPYNETRHGGEEDDGLCGMLGLLTSIFKNNMTLKESPMGRALVKDLFDCCFALPSTSERHLPRCKSSLSRSSCYDLLIEICKGSSENYSILQQLLLAQNMKDSHLPYPFEYWPQDNGRSKAGFCGIQNLGATCYMAAALQFIFMVPEMREAILQAKLSECVRHHDILRELQKMFAFLQESERKAYNPRSFCKMYNMGNQPLNTGEQKDMQEFFTDLLTKMEEMTPTLKVKINEMFRGVITNSVVSLDCPHVSRTFEEFSTIRCQVSDMKDLYASLDLVTVKDCLEGDNKYECGKCEGKVNVCAEKRACFRKMPEVLCLNTMRYLFNLNTMMKEKLNSHFSFPGNLDMSYYMEHKLLGPDKMKDCDEPDAYGVRHPRDSEDDSFEYRLSGVTVHTGTADGGHYYTFIRGDLDKEDQAGPESWLLCNDAEVKPFDVSQIGVECFGGEMTSKTYDSVSDKFLDLSYEKTNSAYMLLYTRVRKNRPARKFNFELSPELAAHIWEDNMQYLKDRNIFEHSYFNFIWQVCGYLPNTMPKAPNDTAIPNDVLLKATQLTASFVLETLIHSKEKPTMVQWIETLTKHFNKCHDACEWFLDHMANDDWWISQIFIKCPTTMVRQLFHRLLFHVINELRPEHCKLYLETAPGEDISQIGNQSCVTRFVKKVLAILDTNVRQYSKHLPEYLHFLLDFAKMGEEECAFLLSINCISTLVTFYMGHRQDNPALSAPQTSYVEILSEDEEEEEMLTLTDDTKPSPMEKMISLIALLVEKSRGREKLVQLSPKDYSAVVGSANKVFAFLLSQIREQINLRQTCNIICSLTRWSENLAISIVNTLFTAIRKLGPENLKTGAVNPIFQHAQPFLKLLTLLVECPGVVPPMSFTQMILPKMWDLAKVAPVSVLEWLTTHVTRNKIAHLWVLDQMDLWVEHYLISHNNVRVRNAAVYLLISLVPCSQFRSTFRTSTGRVSNKDIEMSPEALQVVHKIYKHLLSLLSSAKLYVDPQIHGTMKLVCYFLILQSCILSKREKLMFGPYFEDLWQLFQPKLLEPQIATHHNKQSLLNFWYLVCVDCPENVELITSNPHVCKNIAFNYILADHEDQDIMMFNRMMLPSYYGLLRLCCQHSRAFTRQLALHQNIQWAFKNITPYPSQYTHAVDELYKIMRLMSARYADSTDEELRQVSTFRRSTILMYNRDLEARTHWQTLIAAFKILVETQEEQLLLLYNNGLTTLSESFITLHVMYHEATACHVTNEITDLLTLLNQCLRTVRECSEKKGDWSAKAQCASEMKSITMNWKERGEVVKKLLTLLNSYTPPEVRTICFDVLKQMILTLQPEMISMLVPFLTQWHTTFQENNGRKYGPHKDSLVHSGPFFPRRGQKPLSSKTSIRPPRPQFQMMLHTGLLETMKGVDEGYDQQIYNFFIPYHQLLDTLQRLAINLSSFNQSLINLGAMVALEGVPIYSPYFAKLWNEIYDSESADPDHTMMEMLCKSRYFIDYCDTVLMDERSSLNNFHIFKFFTNFFPKVYEQVLGDQATTCIDNLVAATVSEKSALENIYNEEDIKTIFQRIGGDVRAMLLLFSVLPQAQVNPLLVQTLRQIHRFCREAQEKRAAAKSVECVDVDDSEVRSDEEQAVTSEVLGGEGEGRRKTSDEDGDDVVSTTTESKEGPKEKVEDEHSVAKDFLPPEEKDSEGDTELMCVDVTEASESIEVCTTPTADDVAHPQNAAQSLKRRITDDSTEEPVSKRRHESQEGQTPHSPKPQAHKGDAPESKLVAPVQEVEGCDSHQTTKAPPQGDTSQGGWSSGQSVGASSPQPGPSRQEPHSTDSSRPEQPGTSGHRLERGSSREGEEGSQAPSSSSQGGPSTPKHIMDRVCVDIEQLLQLLERTSS